MESLEEKITRLEKINEIQEERIHNYELMVDNYISMVQKMEDIIYGYEYNSPSLESLFLSCFDNKGISFFESSYIWRDDSGLCLFISNGEIKTYLPLIPDLFNEIRVGESKTVDELKKEYCK